MIKKFDDFYSPILEKRLFIYKPTKLEGKSFRLKSLIEADIYDNKLVEKWKSIYNIDDYAICVFVSESPIKNSGVFDIKLKSDDIKNARYFDDKSISKKGFFIDDSKIDLEDNNSIYLYIFDKGSNLSKRARQIHGFRYENDVKRLNKLSDFSYTHKWDARGKLNIDFINNRIENGKKIEYFDGYEKKEIDNLSELDSDLTYNMCWNIKSIKDKSSIDLGDFLRISGFVNDGGYIKRISVVEDIEKIDKNFIFCVSFHNNDSNRSISNEYIISIPFDKWRKYLPDLESNIVELNDMYYELKSHRIKGDRNIYTEEKWKNFTDKYSKIFNGGIIKIRFKRDTKGQLRIQSSISYNNFVNIILKNKHIKIS